MSDQPIVVHAEPHGAEERRVAERRVSVAVIEPQGPPPSPAPPEIAAPKGMRASALDALRGLFLISMTLGFTISRDDYPLWMYHRQSPPPGYGLVPVPGISWRDLAYGAFLFTMAAALPLTLTKKIDAGETEIGIGLAAIKRYVLLLFFALLVANSNTYFLGYTQAARAVAVLGFCLMALVFTRRRPDWNERRYRVLNRTGWVLAIAFVFAAPTMLGKPVTLERVDEIIAGLAFASLAGSLIWYFTRAHLTARLAVMAVTVALYLSAQQAGWVQDWWNSSPIDWAVGPSKLVLLLVVIPGTIAGDAILRWMREAAVVEESGWGATRLWEITGLCFVMLPVVVVGLYRRDVLLTTQIAVAILVAALFASSSPRSATERMVRTLIWWAALWLIIGLVLDPFEGGIKKAPDTLSYFFTIAGLTTLLLAGLTVITDALRQRRAVNALIDVGHNPLLTYVIYTVLLNSLFEMIPPMRGLLRSSPAEAFVRSVLEVILVVLVVRVASRRRVYWRT